MSTLVTVALFVVLTPGVLVTLPPKSSKLVVAAVHGLLFAVLSPIVHRLLTGREHVTNPPTETVCPTGTKKDESGKCVARPK